MNTFQYAYNCVNAHSIEELHHIVDNQEEITLSELRSKVNPNDLQSLLTDLRYNDDFKIENDWHVSYHKSETEKGETVYYLQHSCIEYIFKQKQ